MNVQKLNVAGSNIYTEFTNCELTTEKTEGNLIAVNQKFLAMTLKSGNNLALVDSSKSTKIKDDQPCLKYTDKILDLKFSPFDNNILASSSLDKSVLLWKIPEDVLSTNKITDKIAYNKHTNKVNFIDFNPILPDIMCTSTFNGEIHVWNIEKKEAYAQFKAPSFPTLISWQPNGEIIGASTNNKTIVFFDPKNNKKISEQKVGDKNYSPKFAWNDDNIFSTVSWDNTAKRVLKLWDMKKLDKEISSIVIDESIRTTTPFVNNQLKIIYTVGKEEKMINLYDYSEGVLKDLFKYNTIDFANCSILYDRKGLIKNKLEIDRFARYCKTKKRIYYTSFFIKENNIYDKFSNSMNDKKKLVRSTWIPRNDKLNLNEIESNTKAEEIKLTKTTEIKKLNKPTEEKKLNKEEIKYNDNNNNKTYLKRGISLNLNEGKNLDANIDIKFEELKKKNEELEREKKELKKIKQDLKKEK